MVPLDSGFACTVGRLRQVTHRFAQNMVFCVSFKTFFFTKDCIDQKRHTGVFNCLEVHTQQDIKLLHRLERMSTGATASSSHSSAAAVVG